MPHNFYNNTFVSANYQVLITDDVLSVHTASLAITCTLPTSPNKGDEYLFKDVDGNGASNNITIDGNGHTVDGSSTLAIQINYGEVSLFFNGTSWFSSANNTVAGGSGSEVTMGGDVTGSSNDCTVSSLQTFTITLSSPNTGDVLMWNGSAWVNSTALQDLINTVANLQSQVNQLAQGQGFSLEVIQAGPGSNGVVNVGSNIGLYTT